MSTNAATRALKSAWPPGTYVHFEGPDGYRFGFVEGAASGELLVSYPLALTRRGQRSTGLNNRVLASMRQVYRIPPARVRRATRPDTIAPWGAPP